MTTIFMIISLSLYILALAVFQPYKKQAHLNQDLVLFFGVLLWNTAILVGLLDMEGGDLFDVVLHLIILTVGSLIPFAYLNGLAIYWLVVVKKVHIRVKEKLKELCGSDEQLHLLGH